MEANKAAKNRWPYRKDLIGWAWLGLRQAMRQFNPGLVQVLYLRSGPHQGFYPRRHPLREPIPKRLLTLRRKVATAQEELSLSLGRNTRSKKSLAVDHPVSHWLTFSASDNHSSVDEILMVSEEEGGLISEDLYSDSDPYESAEVMSRSLAVSDALEAIDPRYAESVSLVVCQGFSVAEARRRTGVSDREIRRRVARGLKELGPLLTEWASSR